MPTRTKSGEATILVLTEEPQIQRLLKSVLAVSGYESVFVTNTASALRAIDEGDPQLVLLDLADARCHNLIVEIRQHTDVPLIVLSDQQRESDLVAAFDLGAGDYVLKPFRPNDLMARTRSVLRRGMRARGEHAIYHRGGLAVDIISHSVTRAGKPIRLAPAEFGILSLLVRNCGRIVP